MAIDPFRLGLVVLLVSRPRPMANLLACWLGAMVAGIALGLAVLVLMRDVALLAIKSAASVITDVRSTVVFLSGGGLQITFGVLALLSVIVPAVRAHARARAMVAAGGHASDLALEPPKPGIFLGFFARLAAITESILQRGPVWPAFVAGLGSATPPYECLVMLTIIMASGAAIETQLSAFILYTVLLLAVIELPLIAFLTMPEKAELVMHYLQQWVVVHRRRISQGVLVVAGSMFVIQGVASL
jgi:hypothetical protein